MARLTISDLEIERNNDAFEYEVESGTVYTFVDPKAVPAKALIHIESLSVDAQLRHVLGKDADAFLDESEIDGYVMEAVMELYMKHYGLGSPPEGKGSPRSSKGTASPSKRTSPRGVSR